MVLACSLRTAKILLMVEWTSEISRHLFGIHGVAWLPALAWRKSGWLEIFLHQALCQQHYLLYHGPSTLKTGVFGNLDHLKVTEESVRAVFEPLLWILIPHLILVLSLHCKYFIHLLLAFLVLVVSQKWSLKDVSNHFDSLSQWVIPHWFS